MWGRRQHFSTGGGWRVVGDSWWVADGGEKMNEEYLKIQLLSSNSAK
mgnify:CR=1 FL=1